MLGSLGEFMNVDNSDMDQIKCIIQKDFESEHEHKQRPRRQRTEFISDDKTIFLKCGNEKKKLSSENSKVKYSPRSSSLQNSRQKPHWIEKDYTKMPKLEKKHKIQIAVAKVKQQEKDGIPKSFFQNSFDHLLNGYSKIYKKPIINFIPKKQLPNREKVETLPDTTKSRNSSLSRQKIIEYQKSIEWAKKRKKNFKYYYDNLGKSVSLAVNENKGKNNYELQEEFERKEGEKVRRVQRKNLLTTLHKIKQPE